MKIKPITTAVSAGFFAVTVLPALAFAAPAAQTNVITEADVARQAENTAPTKNWVVYTRPTAPGTAEFRSGPGTPPAGAGSLELATTTDLDKVYAFNYDHVDTKLNEITAMGYSSYRSAGSAQQATALNVQVDYNGPAVEGGFTTLVFEPVYNTAQGAVVDNTWQTWDAFKNGEAKWWSTKPIPGAPTQSSYVSWATIVAQNQDATILGGFGVNQGSGNPGLTVAVDNLTIGDADSLTVYDFEAVAAPVIALPAKNATVSADKLVKIDWNDVAGATTYVYRSYSDAAYTQPVYESGDLAASEIATPNTPAGDYYVQIQAKDADGNVSAWSNDAANPYKITVTAPVVVPAPTFPETKKDCKKDGYKTFTGVEFKNQGQCVRYVVKEKKEEKQEKQSAKHVVAIRVFVSFVSRLF